MSDKLNDIFDPDQFKNWLQSIDDEPEGCEVCGAVAGCCTKYPNCPGNQEGQSK